MSKKDDYVDISSYSQVKNVYKQKHTKGKVSRIIILSISILLLLGGFGLVYYYNALDSLNYVELETLPSENVDVTEVLEGGDDSLLSSSDVLNILLYGQDAKESEEDIYGRSDTTILLSIDNLHRKLKLTSFQRDTYVTIPGYGKGKLNAAYGLGGATLSIKTIEANFGIKVDKYAIVDFDSFREIISILGGVDMELTLEEIEYINAQLDVNDQAGIESEFIEYDENKELQTIHLDGYQALWYARDRGADCLGDNPEYSFTGDDWDRTARQRKLLHTIMDSLKKNASLKDMVSIVNKVGPLVTTNLKKSDITFLVANMADYLTYEVCEMSIPKDQSTWSYAVTEDKQSVIAITNWDQVRYDLASFIYEDQVSVSGYGSNVVTSSPTTVE